MSLKLKDLRCLKCGAVSVDVLVASEADRICATCGSAEVEDIISAHAGYSISHAQGDSAVKKGAGSFRKG